MHRFASLSREIKNHCSRGVVAFCRRNHSPSRQRKSESEADLVAATIVAGAFFFAATKIRIRRGSRCRYARSRRNRSSLRQRKTESDADLVAATITAGGSILLCVNEKQNRTRRIAAVPGLNREKPCSDSQVWASTNESMPNGHF